MTIRSILLALAAGLASVGTASAADLPLAKAEAIEYVKICSAFGPGFFYIPGSDTCLQISGQTRADYFYTQPASATDNATTFRSDTRIRFDARTQTDFGILRSFIELQALTSGINSQNTIVVRRAYLQFGGLTAGYAWSPYSFYDQYYDSIFFAPYFGEQGRRQLLSYTAQFGKAWAALSIEDPIAHRSAAGAFGTAGTGSGTSLPYGGGSVPDIVGVVGYDDNEGLGRVQVMGAVHQNRSIDPAYDEDYGYAVGLGGNVNFPILAGAYIALETSYSDGAMRYLNSTGADAYGNPVVPVELDRGRGWALQSEAGLNITRALQLVLFGGYLNYDAPAIATHISDNFTYYVIGGQVNYTMVKGFIVGAETWYQNKNPQGSNPDAHAIGAGVRIRRTF